MTCSTLPVSAEKDGMALAVKKWEKRGQFRVERYRVNILALRP